jgi:hypothetical protein
MCKCPGEDHPTYGGCLRSKNLRVAYCQSAKGHDLTAQKAVDRECNAYRAARAQGIQPGSTKMSSVEYALEQSDKTGNAFRADQSLNL